MPAAATAPMIGVHGSGEHGAAGRPTVETPQPLLPPRILGGTLMARYVVQRTFADGLQIPVSEEGAAACLNVVGMNAAVGVTWIHSYVSDD